MSRPAVSFINVSCNSQLIKIIDEETIWLVPRPMRTFTILYLEKTIQKIRELLFMYVEKKS